MKRPVFFKNGRKKEPILVIEELDLAMDNLLTFGMVETVVSVVGDYPKKVGKPFVDPYVFIEHADGNTYNAYFNGGHDYDVYYYDNNEEHVFTESFYNDKPFHAMVNLDADGDTELSRFSIYSSGEIIADGTKRGKTANNEDNKE